MDIEVLKTVDDDIREQYLRKQLGDEKCRILDLRELGKIHWLKDFKELCAYLEEMDEKVNKRNVV